MPGISRQSLLETAAVCEKGGRVLNDHYSTTEYIVRRWHFLANVDRKAGIACQEGREVIEKAADLVFEGQTPRLSVQHVRSRELELQIEPLTPLPTTENTDSINDFLDYPPEEWKDGDPEDYFPTRRERDQQRSSNDREPDDHADATIHATIPTHGSKDFGKSRTRKRADSLSPFRAPKRVKKARRTPSGRLAAIAEGALLPRTQSEARDAADLRKTHLQSALPRRAQSLRNNAQRDLMPEFFEPKNFSRREAVHGAVRCICDDPEPQPTELIGCDRDYPVCGSWQHTACVGDAVPRTRGGDVDRSASYACYVCDPFRHRKMLRTLRRQRG